MARRSILLLIALLIAALGTALIVLYVRGIDERALAEQEPVEVLVATKTIETGESMEEAQAAGKVNTARIPQSAAVETAVGSPEALEDKVALGPIFPGEQLIEDRFGDPGEQEVLPIEEGEMAISVELTDPERVAGFVQNNSEVAIFFSADPVRLTPDGGEIKLPSITKLLLPRVRVVGVGSTTVATRTTKTSEDEQTTEEIPRTILTLAVSQEQAERVIFADRNGDLSFALLSDTTTVAANAGVRAVDLIREVYQ